MADVHINGFLMISFADKLVPTLAKKLKIKCFATGTYKYIDTSTDIDRHPPC